MNLAARLALQTADDVVAICRWLLRRDETLDGRIALWGVSLGCNAVLAAAPLVRPETVAAAYGHADWDLMWKLSWPLFHSGDPSPPPQWTADVRRLIARLEAVEHAAEFFPTAILLVHGAQDRPMVDGMRSLHRRIAPYYARDRRRIRFDRRPGGHAFDDAMAESMRAWIWNWLNRS
jgi:acetyl esterase/lipase